MGIAISQSERAIALGDWKSCTHPMVVGVVKFTSIQGMSPLVAVPLHGLSMNMDGVWLGCNG